MDLLPELRSQTVGDTVHEGDALELSSRYGIFPFLVHSRQSLAWVAISD
jgi:hypothetical protein